MNSDARRFLSSQSQRELHRFAQEQGHRDLYPAYYSYENIWDRLSSPYFIFSAIALALAYFYNLRLQQGRTRPLSELLWDFLVSATPARLLYFLDSWINRPLFPRPQTSLPLPTDHAAKSELLKKILGTTASARHSNIIGSLVNSLAVMSSAPAGSGPRPPGLVNEGSVTCFRNSILQSLATWRPYIEYLKESLGEDDESIRALYGLLEKLCDDSERRPLRVPKEIAYLDTGRQEDAQEYYHELIDSVEKNISKRNGGQAIPNLSLSETCGDEKGEKPRKARERLEEWSRHRSGRNPVEGLTAERVSCITCGYCETLRLEPFKFLTVSLNGEGPQSLSSCIDRLTELERLPGVDCNKCSLVENQKALSQQEDAGSKSLLEAINEALVDEDFDDETIKRLEELGLKRRKKRKTRQTAIARPPKLLAIHISRSAYTWGASKNKAQVHVPLELDLGPWVMGSSGKPKGGITSVITAEASSVGHDTAADFEDWVTDPHASMVASSSGSSKLKGPKYQLSAVVFHKGWSHDGGHYYTFRNYHPPLRQAEGVAPVEKPSPTWFEANDHKVSSISPDILGEEIEATVGDVFMVFYECVDKDPLFVTGIPEVSSGQTADDESGVSWPAKNAMGEFPDPNPEINSE